MIRVAVADDHTIVRAGVRAVLASEPDMVVVGEASDGEGAVELASKCGVDVFLMDLAMPGIDGVETIRRLRAVSKRTRVLVLSMHKSPEFVRPALRAGAVGYVVKGSGLDDLVEAVRQVNLGVRFLDPCVQGIEEELEGKGDDLERLTARERQILCLIAKGETNRTIGESLGLSPKTVDAHRSNLMRKLGLHDAQSLTRFAVRRGMVE